MNNTAQKVCNLCYTVIGLALSPLLVIIVLLIGILLWIDGLGEERRTRHLWK
jgi:hypothetical protein